MEGTRIDSSFQPHLKLSNDKHFAEKLEAIVGLYLNPPEFAVFFSCDKNVRCKRWIVPSQDGPSRRGVSQP